MILSPVETFIEIRDERQLKALTGVTEFQLELLAQELAQVELEQKQAKYEQAVLKGQRTRKPGGGRRGRLTTPKSQVFFVLYYSKVYPTYDELANRFGMSRSAAFDNLQKYFPLVQEALSRLGVLPSRTFANPEEFREAVAGVSEIIIDVTERRQVRPTDPVQQKDRYSGKKKMHTVKNTVIATLTTFILFIGQTFGGRHHDYKIFQADFSTNEAWFDSLAVLVDLAYQGIDQDYEIPHLQIPVKKPRTSKKNPHPTLTAEQAKWNRELSRQRVRVEHAIAGLKRFNLLADRFRGRKPHFLDDALVMCAGFWNLNLLYV
jgi:hypothetical protein